MALHESCQVVALALAPCWAFGELPYRAAIGKTFAVALNARTNPEKGGHHRNDALRVRHEIDDQVIEKNIRNRLPESGGKAIQHHRAIKTNKDSVESYDCAQDAVEGIAGSFEYWINAIEIAGVHSFVFQRRRSTTPRPRAGGRSWLGLFMAGFLHVGTSEISPSAFFLFFLFSGPCGYWHLRP